MLADPYRENISFNWWRLDFQRAVNQIYIFSRFTLVNHNLNFLLSYFVNKILGYNFETIVRSNSILEHRSSKRTKNEFLMVVLIKYIILKKIKIQCNALLKQVDSLTKYHDNILYFGLILKERRRIRKTQDGIDIK